MTIGEFVDFIVITISCIGLMAFFAWVTTKTSTNEDIANDPENTITKQELDKGLIYREPEEGDK